MWSQTTKLESDSQVDGDWFGYSVSLSGDRALIGAIFDNESKGAAYIFDFESGVWSQTNQITADDSELYDLFGNSVSLSGNRAVIGSKRSNDDIIGDDTGSVYVYDFSGSEWVQVVKLIANDAVTKANFGYSVSLYGDSVLIGANYETDYSGSSTGYAYIFNFDGNAWSQTIKLEPVGGNSQDHFGASVKLINNRALIGSGRTSGNSFSLTGSAYIFDLDNGIWSQSSRVLSNNGINGISFGSSVGLSGDRILIGNHNDSGNYKLTGSAYSFELSSGIWSQKEKIITEEVGAAKNDFGFSVSISGDNAMVGTFQDHDIASASGAVYVYKFNGSTWLQETKILGNTQNSNFGYAISLEGSRALIAAKGESTVYVYEFNGGAWGQTGQLTANDGENSDYFGTSVSLSGDRALVSAYGDDDNGSLTGSAYIFDLNSGVWSQTTKLTANDGASGDQFSKSISLSGDRALIGSQGDADNGSYSGSAYVFDLNNGIWSQTDKLKALDAAPANIFGESVSLSGDRALIGATGVDLGDIDNVGAAYVFEFNDGIWSQTAKLGASDAAKGDWFGAAVSINENRALIGAFHDDDFGSNSGAAFIFELSSGSWSEITKITASDGASGDYFAENVNQSGENIIIGARLTDDYGTDSGSAYIFKRSYFIGGNVTGLLNNNTIEIQNNASDDLIISSNGVFAFTTTLGNGEDYDVTIKTTATNPVQTCTVVAGSATVAGEDVSDIGITCDFGDDFIFGNGFE